MSSEQKGKKIFKFFIELQQESIKILKAIQEKDFKAFLTISKSIRKYKNCLKPHHFKAIENSLEIQLSQVKLESLNGFDPTYEEKFEIKSDLKPTQSDELLIYFKLLLAIFLERNGFVQDGQKLLLDILQLIKASNKRHLDFIHGLTYFYLERTYEKLNNLLALRKSLHEAYRIACLQKNEFGQTTLLNLLLRNYIKFNEYESAFQLLSKADFPENKSNNEYVRYLFYMGKIKAMRTEYDEAKVSLIQAYRKAPDSTADGFKTLALKSCIVVTMLQGEIPARELFTSGPLEKLIPYYRLVQSVVKGNIEAFQNNCQKYKSHFKKDGLWSLIERLHQTVIRTGLKRLNISYSKISLSDVAKKLNLANSQVAEFNVAKAIRDGVLKGKIDHENQVLHFEESKNLYSTDEPQKSFDNRSQFCMQLYNTAVKALQFPNEKLYKEEAKDDDDELSIEDLLDFYDEF